MTYKHPGFYVLLLLIIDFYKLQAQTAQVCYPANAKAISEKISTYSDLFSKSDELTDDNFLHAISGAYHLSTDLYCGNTLQILGLNGSEDVDSIASKVEDFKISHLYQSKQVTDRLQKIRGFITTGSSSSSGDKLASLRFIEYLLALSATFGSALTQETKAEIKEQQLEFSRLTKEYDEIKNQNFCINQADADSVIKDFGKTIGNQLCFASNSDLLAGIKLSPTRRIREAFYAEIQRRAEIHRPTIEKILKLRVKFASLLHIDSWASVDLLPNAFKSLDEIITLMNGVKITATELATREFQVIQSEAGTLGFDPAPWDERYLRNLIDHRTQRQSTDFKFQKSDLNKILKRLASEVFLVDLNWQDSPTKDGLSWFTLSDKGQMIGRYAVDLSSRSGKELGASGLFLPLDSRDGFGGILATSLVASQDGKYYTSLQDLSVIFHEFGHLLQHALSDTKHPYFFVEPDLLEAPAVMLEYLVLLPAFMKKIMQGIVPEAELDSLVVSLRENRLRWAGLDVAAQIYFAKLSLQAHSSDLSHLTLTDLSNSLYAESRPFYKQKGPNPGNFSHLISSGSTYYKYLLSQLIALEMFSEAATPNHDLSQSWVLKYKLFQQKFGLEDSRLLLRSFIGRPISAQAYQNYLLSSGKKSNKGGVK